VIRKIHMHDLAGYISRVPKERHDAAVKAARRTMHERGRMFVVQANRAAQPRPAFDRGDYERSWKVVNIAHGVRIFSQSVYASIIERGRRPGTFPPIQPLVDWVHRHKLATNESVLKSAELSIAFAIAASIKRRGLPAKHVFERASVDIIKACRQACHNAIADAEGRP